MDLRWAHFLAGAVIVLFAVALAREVVRGWRRRNHRRRLKRARRGEVLAESILCARGFSVLEQQAESVWRVPTSAGDVTVNLRADLIVEKNGKTYVAEVKTGEVAPSLRTPGTRRQLLEYAHAFAVDGVLLVDPEASAITEVWFPPRRAIHPPRWTLLGAALVGAIGALILRRWWMQWVP